MLWVLSFLAFHSCCVEFEGLQQNQIYILSNEQNIVIRDCFFEFEQTNNDAWGGYICIDYNQGDTVEFSIQTTTINNAIGAKGGALYLRNVNAVFDFVCVNNAQIFPEKQDVGAFLYQCQSEQNSANKGSLQLTQTSVINSGSSTHDQPFYPSTVTTTINALNMSCDHSSATLLYAEGDLSITYSSFSHNDNPSQVVQCEGILNVDSCTFFNNTIGIMLKTADSIIKNSYFFENSEMNIILAQEATIESCTFDSLKIQGSYKTVGVISEIGDGTLPSNFNEKMMATELCPAGTFYEINQQESSSEEETSSEIEETSSNEEVEETSSDEKVEDTSSMVKEDPIQSSVEEKGEPSSELEDNDEDSSSNVENVESSEEEAVVESKQIINENTEHVSQGNKVDDAPKTNMLPIIIGCAAGAIFLIILIIIITIIIIKKKKKIAAMEDTASEYSVKDQNEEVEKSDDNDNNNDDESDEYSSNGEESEGDTEEPNHFTEYSTSGENLD